MIICICNVVSDEQIIDIIKEHKCLTVKDVQQHLKVSDACRQCWSDIESILTYLESK